MNLIIRGLAVYFFILLIFRIAGKKSLSESTTFDLVLLLIISEVTQQALVGEDFSISASFLLIMTLVGTDVLISWLKFHWKPLGKLTEGMPLIIVNKGIPLFERMYKARVEYDDILEAARQLHGIGTFDEIEYAVLEKDGSISIIPKSDPDKRTTSKIRKDG
ncbi:MAG TPA: YetF domain-containing protein [Flavisolibacter sp.]|nr:YetF domain-containing protein [Flavisolibacter sp.]